MYLTKCDKSAKYSYTRKVTLTRGFLKVLLEICILKQKLNEALQTKS